MRADGHAGGVTFDVYSERLMRVSQLTRAGHSAPEIAVRLGLSSRTVERYRARAREVA